MNNTQSFIDKEVKINLGTNVVNGILTHPPSEGPYPAIILLHGSARTGVDDPYLQLNAESLVKSGFAILRYDGPGWGGKSAQRVGIETLQDRTDEAILIIKYLQSRGDIQSEKIGLWGISQGGWICQMAAASFPDVAFIIPVSGPGVSPAEQEVYRVEAQSRAEGFEEIDITKAILTRRLIVDILLEEPSYQDINQAEAVKLGPGPWDDMLALIESANSMADSRQLDEFIKILNSIRDAPWAKYLYIDQYWKMLESFPIDQWGIIKSQMRTLATMDPGDYLPKVHCPIFAIFGEADKLVPVEKSVQLYEKYLTQAGNDNVRIQVFPKADHGIFVDNYFAPGYFECIGEFLESIVKNRI